MHRLIGELWGFTGPTTKDVDAARMRILLDAWADMSVPLFAGAFRTLDGKLLPSLADSPLVYVDPRDVDPPLRDAARTWIEGGGACANLCIYQVGFLRSHGEPGASFELRYWAARRLDDGKIVNRWHIVLKRANGTLEDWSRARGMTI